LQCRASTRIGGRASFRLAKTVRTRPLRRPARGHRCARSHPRHGRRRTTARRYRSGKLRQNRRAHPSAKRPDKTTRGSGLLFDSLVATYSLSFGQYTPGCRRGVSKESVPKTPSSRLLQLIECARSRCTGFGVPKSVDLRTSRSLVRQGLHVERIVDPILFRRETRLLPRFV
jgi:hypothetical protein